MVDTIMEFIVIVRLPDQMGTVTEVRVQARDHYTAERLAESMTNGSSMGARRSFSESQ